MIKSNILCQVETTTTRSTSSDEQTPSNYPRSLQHTTLQNVAKLSIVEDKPVLFDYWTGSCDKLVLIGVRDNGGEKLLVKSEDEYTSPIAKIYQVEKEYIIVTENSIYISFCRNNKKKNFRCIKE